MNRLDVGKFARVVMKDSFVKTGTIEDIGEKSVTLIYNSGIREEIFFDAIASMRIGEKNGRK